MTAINQSLFNSSTSDSLWAERSNEGDTIRFIPFDTNIFSRLANYHIPFVFDGFNLYIKLEGIAPCIETIDEAFNAMYNLGIVNTTNHVFEDPYLVESSEAFPHL